MNGEYVEQWERENEVGLKGAYDPEIRDKIFEPGVSSKSGGWGVGLALSRRIVEGPRDALDLAFVAQLGVLRLIVGGVVEDSCYACVWHKCRRTGATPRTLMQRKLA